MPYTRGISMNNRRWNCKNPYQGDAKKVLCVCSAGLLRSPTAAKVLWKEYGYNTRSCGLDVDHALIPIDEVLMTWADEIVCMTHDQLDYIRERYQFRDKPIVCLGIQDSYAYMDTNLIANILTAYKWEVFGIEHESGSND